MTLDDESNFLWHGLRLLKILHEGVSRTIIVTESYRHEVYIHIIAPHTEHKQSYGK